MLFSFLTSLSTISQTCVTTITTFPYAESFEGTGTGGFGAWVQDTGDNLNWLSRTLQTPSGATGPLNASDLSYYIFTEATNNSGKTAFLNSPCFDLTGLTNPEFSFDYHMYGLDMGNLKIQVSTNNGTSWSDIGWAQNGQSHIAGATPWSNAIINLSAYTGQTIKLRFHGSIGGGYRSDMSVDNATLYDNTVLSGTCTSTVNTFPYNEGFEGTGTGGIGAWIQEATDNGEWTVQTGGTPSVNTGPSGAVEGSYYAFTEATNGGTNPGSPYNTAFLNSPCFNLTGLTNPELSFSYHMYGSKMGTLKIQVSTNNGGSWADIGTSISGQQHAGHTTPWSSTTINLSAYIGQTVMLRFHATTGADYRSDMCIDGVSITDTIAVPEINILGNSIIINNGDTTPSTTDHTDFGTIDISSSIARTYTIENIGSALLNLTGASPYVTITGSDAAEFSVTTIPSNSIAAGTNTTFEITLNPTAIGIKSATINILSDDSDENPHIFNIKGNVEQDFFDSDGDGILDNIDIDDDNDGISDVDEELNCFNSAISSTTNYTFLKETFGTGGFTTIDTNYPVTTTYCYEDGSGTNPCTAYPGNTSLNDGEYTVKSTAMDHGWNLTQDHTLGDTNGRMAAFNASHNPGVFYETTITGAIPNTPITYSFWIVNLVHWNGLIEPDILVEFRDSSNNLLSSLTTGNIPPRDESGPNEGWHQFTADLTFNVSEFTIRFINNAPGGGGNDLAIDDIEIIQRLCDSDGDNIANVFDLDSDNDGIPDVVEAGLGTFSNGTGILSNAWLDTNGNGMHDAAEGNTVLDTDGDGTPNYIDLDSDNDAIFDVDESGAGNTADPNFQNGDGDIDGDGTGDGPDTDYIREGDPDGDGIINYYADGILDVFDYFNGAAFNTSYGNNNQGMGYTYYVLDTDSDGIPDYMDTTSNGSTYDILNTLYTGLDANNDGVIDDLTDTDYDGIVDLFDTDDASFGSPRDLDRKLLLYFDGRNDYVEDTNIIDGLGEATIMGWIKLDASGSGNQTIIGQNEFYIRLKSDGRIEAGADNHTLTQSTALPLNQWIHVGATYSNTNSIFKLYINGDEVDNIAISGNLPTDESDFTLGRKSNTDTEYFKGYLDEVRVFSKALDLDEYQKIVYQEIENNTLVRGTVIPRDVATLPWTDLLKYYRLDSFKNDITDNLTTPAIDTGTGAKLYNIKVFEYQNAPMPFITQTTGSLETAVNIPADGVNGMDAVTYDSSIILVEHDDVFYTGDQKHVGLFVNPLDAGSNPIEFSIQNDSELNVSWYLKLDGFIDLEGESQLVQRQDSQLDVTSSGHIERDQQGTADTFTYNYWSSPVSIINNTSNNTSYTIPDVLRDGTNPSTPGTINLLTSGYDGSNTNPVGIADYWIWKFANQTDDDYSAWQHMRSTGSILAGEGYTMKGPGTGSISTDQNYVFNGKPNNGDISLTIGANNDYLIGNPYPSAMDAHVFLGDNPGTSGTLYFWEHWGGGSHNLADYQGGYAQYNYSGGVASASQGTNDPDVATGGTPIKTPGQYIPVSQGFFVYSPGGGTIKFENDQRIFEKEGAASTSFRMSSNSDTQSNSYNEDGRMKFRIGFNSSNQIHRQLLLTVDDNATENVDWGYDGKLNEEQMDDMYWMIDEGKYIIQGRNAVTTETVTPLGIHVRDDGMNSITIDHLENVPNDVEIYAFDNVLNIYHDLRQSDYQVHLTSGEYLNRFALVFTSQNAALSNPDFELNNAFELLYNNDNESVIIHNPNLIEIDSLELFNILGQSIFHSNEVKAQNYTEIKVSNLSAGTYIINLNTVSGKISKKVLVK